MKKYILSVLLLSTLVYGKAHAQWVVTDPTNFAGNIANTVKEIATAGKTVKNTLNGFKEVEKLNCAIFLTRMFTDLDQHWVWDFAINFNLYET